MENKYQPLTESLFYILLAARKPVHGYGIIQEVEEMTGGRVSVGPGTLYNLLDQFSAAGMIRETGVEGRRRSYLLTKKGSQALQKEYERLCRMTEDFNRVMEGGEQ